MASVTVTLSVNWNGTGLSGVSAINDLREALPSVPVTHFVSSAYFARGGRAGVIASQMLAGFRLGDELAALVAPWASIHGSPMAAKAPEQLKPPKPYAVAYEGIVKQTDSGGTDWLSGYPEYTIEAFLTASLAGLEPLSAALIQAGRPMKDIQGVRASGWAANDVVIRAFANDHGLLYDASAANAVQCEAAVADASLRLDTGHGAGTVLKSLSKLWGGPTESPDYLRNATLSSATGGIGVGWTTQALFLSPQGTRPLLELPNTCMTPPLCAPNVTAAFVQRCLAGPPNQNFTVSIAIDQETAVADAPALQAVLEVLHSNERVCFATHASVAQGLMNPPPGGEDVHPCT